MAAPTGYDLGLTHSAVNGGVAVGFLLEEDHDEPFVEEQDVVASHDVTTAGVASVASYGLGAVRYRLRLALRADVLKRDHRPTTETPATLRTRLLEYAAKTDGQVRLDTDLLSRRVAFLEAVKFVSGPEIDGFVALLVLADVGA
jgi:hypothetical protein